VAEELGAAVLRIDVDIESLQAQLNTARKLVERQRPFQFQIDTGTSATQFRQLEASAKTLETQFKRLLSTPLNLNSAGLRKLGEDAVKAGVQINDFARSVVNGNKPLATSIAALQQQSSAFRTLAANVKVGTAEYINFTQAAIKAEQKQLLAGFTDIEASRKLFAGGSGSFADAFKGIDELLEFAKRVKDSPAAIKLYVQALQQAADVTSITDTNFAKLNAEIDRQTNALERAQQAAKRYNQIFNLTNQPKALPPGRGPGPYVFSAEQTPEERRAQEGAARRAAKIEDIRNAQAGPAPTLEFPTLGRDLERLQGLEFRLNNAKKGSAEYEKVLRLLTLTQRNFANATEQSAQALAKQQTATGGFREFSQSLQDPAAKAIERGRERAAQRTAREQAIQDTFQADLDRTRERRLAEQRSAADRAKAQKDRRARTEEAISSGTIGFGFPLLFGQGIGAAIGGGIGGAGGGLRGGGFGFALSIIGTAVGDQFDVIITKSKDLANALRDPIANFDLLKQSSQLSSLSTERYIEALIKVGREGEAAALIQQDLSNTYGNLDDARALATAQDELARSWAKLSTILAGGLLPGLAGFTANIAALLERLSGSRRGGTPPPQGAPRGGGLGGAMSNLTLFGLSPSLFFLNQMGARARNGLRGPAQPAPAVPPEVLEAQQDRASLLSNELRLITAQTQGYKEQELSLKLAVAADKERVDLAVLNLRLRQAAAKDRPALQVEIDERKNQTLKERVQLQEELAEVQRKNQIAQETRPAIQQQSLALLNAQVTGAQRQALIEERRLSALETERQLRLEGNRDPVRRGEIVDQGLLAQARLTAQLNQLDKERAAASRQITFDAREQAQVGQRQLSFARQRLVTESDIVRQTLEQRQAVIESIAAATERQQRAQFSFNEALRQGGDAGQQRAFEIASKDIPDAARQLQLSLVNGATAIRDAGRDLSLRIQENARSLQNLYLTSEFATGEQRQRATADLDRQVEAEARRRNVIFTVSGDERQRTAAKQGFLDFGRQESELIRQGNQLAEALTLANKPLVDSNSGLVGSQATLIEAINTLNQKDWAVNLSVASDGTVSPTGDILSRAAGAL
jgi:hypothetical protein